VLELKEIATEYHRVPMLRNVNVRVEKRSIVCLLGPNGAGKTTTVKTILGLVRPTTGTISFESQMIHHWKTHRIIDAGITVVPEGRRLFPKMTVLENLKFGILTEVNEAEVRKRLEMVFLLFPRLKERIHQLAGTLSGGEQGMAAIGRGMMGKPKMILFDEPSLGLAPILVEDFFKAIKKINEEGTTILLIEQNARKALSIASKGYVLQKGEIILQGSKDELYDSDLIKKAYLKE
jgi:branched-chain amino acid transport system ATP-binding protein